MINYEDVNEKKLFPKFQLIPIFRFQVMHDYVHYYCSLAYTRINGKIDLIST